MQERTCEVQGCERRARSVKAKWCNTHYFRWYRTGNVGSAEVWDRKRKPCTMTDCTDLAVANGYCSRHHQRIQSHGDPDHVTAPLAGEHNGVWLGDEVGYCGAHSRVHRQRGSAHQHSCERCEGTARHWAYDHADPAERYEQGYGPYSPDPAHYLPLCVPCHKRFDLAHISASASQT